MSAYVNCGMIDPLRMARDAARVSEKFVSEFCGFRESAHLWCLRNPGAYLDASRAVPAWARNQLRATAAAPDVEALARGASGDAYWDDCQKCLVLSGELHNNVRIVIAHHMTMKSLYLKRLQFLLFCHLLSLCSSMMW